MQDIRRATLSDLPEIIRIWREGAAEAFNDNEASNSMDEASLENHFSSQLRLQNDSHRIWVYQLIDGSIAGYCSVLPMHPSPMWYMTWGILSLYIARDYQEKSIGKLLIDFALKQTSKSSIKYVLSTVVLSNTRSINLVKKGGWQSLGKMPQNIVDNHLPDTELLVFET